MKIRSQDIPRVRTLDAARQLLDLAMRQTSDVWTGQQLGPNATEIENERKKLAAMAAIPPETETQPLRLMSLGAWIALSWLLDYDPNLRPPHSSISMKAAVITRDGVVLAAAEDIAA
jgi:hypothetical protein